jgi:hypothetical protein
MTYIMTYIHHWCRCKVAASVPSEVSSGEARFVQALHERLDQQMQALTHDSTLDELIPAFSTWYNDEKTTMGACPLGDGVMNDAVTKHMCYGRMCAVWDSQCSCEENTTVLTTQFV